MPRHRPHAQQLVHLAILCICNICHDVTGVNAYDGTSFVAGEDSSNAILAGESTGGTLHQEGGAWTRQISRYEVCCVFYKFIINLHAPLIRCFHAWAFLSS